MRTVPTMRHLALALLMLVASACGAASPSTPDDGGAPADGPAEAAVPMVPTGSIQWAAGCAGGGCAETTASVTTGAPMRRLTCTLRGGTLTVEGFVGAAGAAFEESEAGLRIAADVRAGESAIGGTVEVRAGGWGATATIPGPCVVRASTIDPAQRGAAGTITCADLPDDGLPPTRRTVTGTFSVAGCLP